MMKMLSKQNPFQKRPVGLFVGLRFLLVLILPLLPLEEGSAEGKMTIGEVEEVILMPWGVRLPARIDTGAATSSLDARELIVKDNMAEFRLPKMYGGLRLNLDVIGWQKIRSAEFRERRPVVEITFCIGPRLVRAQVTLNNRTTVTYPLIIGRNILKDRFVVDCMKSNCLPPTCKEVPSQ
jgi:hypothetical protein